MIKFVAGGAPDSGVSRLVGTNRREPNQCNFRTPPKRAKSAQAPQSFAMERRWYRAPVLDRRLTAIPLATWWPGPYSL